MPITTLKWQDWRLWLQNATPLWQAVIVAFCWTTLDEEVIGGVGSMRRVGSVRVDCLQDVDSTSMVICGGRPKIFWISRWRRQEQLAAAPKDSVIRTSASHPHCRAANVVNLAWLYWTLLPSWLFVLISEQSRTENHHSHQFAWRYTGFYGDRQTIVQSWRRIVGLISQYCVVWFNTIRRLCVGAKNQCHYPRPVLDDEPIPTSRP